MIENEKQQDASKKSTMKRRDLLSVIASSIAGGAAILSISFAMNAFFDQPTKIEFAATSYVAELDKKLEKHQAAIEEIKNRLNSISSVNPSTDTGRQIAAVQADLKTATTRLETLEKGLLESPQKALSVPLLRNDLENLKNIYKQDIEAMAKNVDRVYDQNKWFIGLMFTMAIGLIGLAVSNYFQSRKA